jgi:hypothetical protein
MKTGVMQKILLNRKYEAFHNRKGVAGFIEIP